MRKIKLNILDISVVIIIILLVFATFIKFRTYNVDTNENSSLENIQYEVRIGNVREYTANAFEIGDKLYDSQTNVLIGTITDKKIEPHYAYEKISTGELVKVDVPEKYNLRLVVETEGSVTQDGYYANRSVELKVGSDKPIETLYAKTTARIIDIEVKK
jgi:hypothetical protein